MNMHIMSQYVTYYSSHYLSLICFLHVPQIFNSFGIDFGNGFNILKALVKEFIPKKYFSYFSSKTYIVGTQKNRLIETVLLGTQNIC